MSDAPLEGLTLQVAELRRLLDKAEATCKRAIAERVADWHGEECVEDPDGNIASEIGGSIERLEIVYDEIFLLRAVYAFDDRCTEVVVSVSDLIDLLSETDFS